MAETTATDTLLNDYLTRDQLADELGIGYRTIARLDSLRQGPPRLMLAGRVLYPRDAARKWLAARVSEQAAAG